MTQAIDIIKGALRNITAYQAGDTISPADEQDALDVLNDLLDSWSTDQNYVYGSEEFILSWVNGQSKYLVGNPTNTDLGLPDFTGTLTGSSNVITGITNIPLGLKDGSTLTDVANVIPLGTTVTGIGSTTVTMSANATATPASGPDTISYTLPGDFAIPRPLRITGGYTRINNLDFWLDVYATQDQYNSILYKAQPGPWPTIAWYNAAFPYGILNVYQTPGQSASLHLFTDTILSNLTINQQIIMPQGYVRALKWLLARELAPMFGVTLTRGGEKNAREAMDMITALNAKPAERGGYDRMLSRGNRPDGGWIISGGFY